MELKQLFHTIFKSLNPESHKELHERTFGYAFKYFFFILLLSMVLMMVLFIPKFLSLPAAIEGDTQNFERMDINFSFSLLQSFNMLEDPLVKIEKKGVNFTDEKILITEEGIYYKQYFFFGNPRFVPINEGFDIKSGIMRSSVSTVLWLLLPSIIFWGLIFFAIYFLIIIMMTCLVFMLFSWAFRISLGWTRVFKSAIYSSTVLVSLQLILMPFYRIVILPVVAYWILLLIVILVLKDEMHPHGRSSLFVESSHHKDVFKKHESFDVDETDNLKSGKRKKSFDEENDGYVELK
jgi:hypothetical protein